MKEVDLSDYFDDCYSGYEDFTAEIVLHRNQEKDFWYGDGEQFSDTGDNGWKYRTDEGEYNYGYDTLEEAVTKYVGGLTNNQVEKGRFCASSFQNVIYKMNAAKDTINCQVTKRFFLPECDEQKFRDKCETLTHAFNMLMS